MRVRNGLLGIAALVAVSVPTSAQFIGWPDTNAGASATNNAWPMAQDVEWRYQYLLPAACFPAAPFKITDMAFAQHGGFSSSHPGTYQRWQVRMTLTTVATLSTNLDRNLGNCPVTVMQRPNFTWAYAPDTWTDFGLDCAFGYDGTSDVLIEIRYTGGSTANLPMRAENPPGGARVLAKGVGSYNASTATFGPSGSGLPKTRFTIDRTCVMLALTPQVSIGNSGAVQVVNASPGAPYQIATALGHTTQLSLGSCSICLNPDVLFFLSVTGNPLFSGYAGTVAANGTYAGKFGVPALRGLIGVCLSHASVTLNPLCCTNTVTTEIVP